ncbi:MAG: ABC transporter permease subunit [Gammaproteobacteria bacterium]|nr:ABC transporter permease subunit [Gammaproteobacteria bacterium]
MTISWLWLGAFALIPISLVFFTSILTQDTEKLVSLPVTLRHYLELFNSAYVRILLQSFYLAFSCAIICLILGYPFAFTIARCKSRYRSLLLLLIIIPFWTSSLIRTYAIMAIIKTKGLLNTLLLALGIIHHPMHILYSYTAVLIGSVYDLLPFMILPLYANIEKLDDTLLEAARDLGASKATTFIKIILPLTLPGIVTGIILVFLPAMTMFYIPVLLGGAKNLLLGNLIQNQFLVANNWPMGAAISIFVIFLMCLMIFIYWRKSESHDFKAEL